MTRPVVWSPDARIEFLGIIRHIAQNNPRAAAGVADRLDEVARQLGVMATGRDG